MNSTTKDHVTQADFAKNPTMHSLNLFNNNWSINQISREYNTTPKQIVSYLGKKLIVKRINALYQSGIEYREIAEKIGLDLRTIYRYLEATRSNDSLTAEEILKTLELLGKNFSLTRISSELNKTTKIIQQTLLQKCMYEYLQLKSLKDLMAKYKISKAEISQYLQNHNITVLDSGDKTKLITHIDNGNFQFWRPISPYLEEVIIGELLGDGNMRVNIHSSTPNRKSDVKTPTIVEYKLNLDSINSIVNHPNLTSLSDRDLSKKIRKFNSSIEKITSSPTAHFRLTKSISEYNWVTHIASIFETHNYPIRIRKFQRKTKTGNLKSYMELVEHSKSFDIKVSKK